MPLLATVKLPENITSIGEYAFYKSGIREITIPASVTEIGKYAFNNCNDLLRFNYESSSTVHIGQYALVGSALSDVYISGTDITIDGYALSLSADSRLKMAAQNIRFEYYACRKVKELDLTASSVFFGDRSFNAPGLTSVTGDFAATYIGQYAFPSMPSLTITGDNCRLCTSAFGSTSSVELKLRGTFSSFDKNCLPSNLTSLDISEVTAIKKIETLGVSCAVRELIFPDFTEEITLGRCSFDCPYLTKLRLPGGLVTIPGVDKLPPYATSSKGGNYYVATLDDLYRDYYPVVKCPKLITLIIPSTVKEIGAFPKYVVLCKEDNITYTIAEGPTELIFEDGIALNSLAFKPWKSDHLGYTAYGTFESCTKLALVHFGGDVNIEYLDNRTFMNCTNLQEFSVGEGSTIDKIGTYAFYGCRNLITVNLPHNVKSVYASAFYGCSSLETILLGDELQTIRDNAFSGCSSLKTMDLGKSLTSIGASAFQGCTALSNLTIPSKVTSIGASAFEGCTSLTEMTLSPGVTEIGNRMMYGCTGLQTLSMPSSVKKIGTDAFYGCENLTSFKIPSACTSIGTGAFAGCTGMKDVYSYTLEPTEITETTFPNMATSTLHVPQQAYYTYYYKVPWNKFLHISTFLEPFDYFYLNGDMKLDSETGVIEGEPDAELNAGGGLILKDQIGQKLGDVHLKNDGTISASLLYDASTEIVEGARFYQEIDVKANQWYFFCFPFDALREDVTSPGSYIFRYYDSQERAQNGTGNSWKKLPPLAEEPWLHAGMGYIYQTNTAGTLTVPVNQPDFTNVNRAQDLQVYNAANTANASWNFTGNVTPGYYEIGDMKYDAPITIWDGKTYVAYRPGDDVYLLSPYQAFFVQRPVGAESLQFAEDARLTYTQGQKAVQAKQARRRAAAQRLDRLVFDMVLSLDSLSDRTRVVYNDMATTAYDLDHDASKFFSMDASMPQFYSLDVQQECYAINERPTADGRVRLGYYAPQAGTYTIRAERLDAFCKLYDRVTGRIIDLDLDEYTFQSEAGTFDDRFEFRCSADVNGIALIQQQTGVKLQGGEGQIVLQGASADKPVHIYNVAGDLVTVAEEDGAISLPKGAYVVAIGRVSTKVMVR